MFVLFIGHHILNRRWWRGLFPAKRTGEVSGGNISRKGNVTAVRILNVTVNLFLAVFMILQPVSGILMSKYVLKDVTVSGLAGTLRTIHMTFAYWGFMVMSFHLGLHAGVLTAPFSKKMNKTVKMIFRVLFLIISAYGVYVFIRRGIGDYLLMRVMFAYFDFGESRLRFMLDYTAVMVLVATIGFYIQSGLLRIQNKQKGR